MPKHHDLTEAERRAIAARRHEMPTGPVDDPDNPEWTAEDFRKAKRIDELAPAQRAAIQAAFPKTKAGRPKKADAKQVVTLRLNPSLLAAYQAQGEGWRGRMEAVLTEAVARHGAAPMTPRATSKPATRAFKPRLKGDWKAP